MNWGLCPWALPIIFAAYIVLQLALGMTWGRTGKVWHVRRENPRRYWLSIFAQTAAAAALIAAFLLLGR
jgi:hypothetical protein